MLTDIGRAAVAAQRCRVLADETRRLVGSAFNRDPDLKDECADAGALYWAADRLAVALRSAAECEAARADGMLGRARSDELRSAFERVAEPEEEVSRV